MSGYIASLLLVLLVSAFTVYPFFFGHTRKKQGVRDAPEADRLERLYEKRDIYYSSIKDIELDRDMGKLNDKDYAELLSRYKEKAATVTKLISEFQSAEKNERISKEVKTSPFETPIS